MIRIAMKPAVAALLVAALGACDSTGGTRAVAVPKMASGNALLAQVRSAGQLGNELDVQPLRDPQVEDLRAAATAAEARADWAGAQAALDKALGITPTDPELLQWRAEIALVSHDFARAQQLATQSWDRGPKLGGLCRRNWTTLRFAAESRRDAVAAAHAQERSAACAVAPPNRY